MTKVSDLKPHPKNRNVHPQNQIERLAKILEYQGFRYPVKVSRLSGYVTSGHGRIEAAKLNGWKEVPVIHQDYEDTDQEIADLNADNEIARWATLDMAGLNKDLADFDPSFDVDMLGIKDFVIEPADKYADQDADDVPDTPKEPITKLGDVYELGQHRLLCGDATKDVDQLLDGAKVDMAFTDPPYGIGFKYESYEDSIDAWFPLINAVVPKLKAVADFVVMPSCRIVDLGWWYANHDPDWIMCWYKGSPGHRSKIGFNDWEPHLVWGKPKKQMHDYWQTKCGFEVDGHPCPKPVEYAQWVVERAVNQKGTVLDVFGGSGTTIIACEKTKRKCYMMELEPKYCDVIVSRYVKFTGNNKVFRNGEEVIWDGR